VRPGGALLPTAARIVMDADILTFGMAACIAVSILFCLRNPR